MTASPVCRRTLLGVATAAMLVLTACSSSGTSSGNSPAAATGGDDTSTVSTPAAGSTSSGSSVTAKAQQMVAKFEATTKKYPLPTAPIKGVSALKGRTIYYIPLVQQIPAFALAATVMKGALAKVGMKLQVCNGQAQPTAVASCVQQAVSANAAGIITDAIPYGMAQNAFDAAKSKVPILIGDQSPEGNVANTNQVSYVTGVLNWPTQLAWWMIADSNGKANAIFGRETDSPSAAKSTDDAIPVFKNNCPDCKIVVKDISASTPSLLASQVSANLAADPGATYYYGAYEDSLQPTVQGIQQAGKSSTVALTIASATVNSLSIIKRGGVVKAAVSSDQPYESWALIDEILRMATKSGPVNVQVPSRLFTKDNIGSIKVTDAAQASGEWFGSTSYEQSFLKLWGAG